MNLNFILLNIGTFLIYSNLLDATESNEQILYGACYQFNKPNSGSIVLSTENLNIDFEEDYEFEKSNGPISCIWFDTHPKAQSALTTDTAIIQINFNKNNNHLQESTQDKLSEIVCNNHKIHLHKSHIKSKHLCDDSCHSDNQQSCFTVSATRSFNIDIPASYHGESNISPLIPSMFGISGICIAFIVVGVVIYCFGVRYSRWTEEKSGNETDRVIGDVLEEIAKYTIGDDEEEGYYDDWNEYVDSDRSESSHSEEEALGMTILRVVSSQTIPEIPNPSIYSSESETESDEEQCRQDLLVAKETLYAVSYGTNNPYSSSDNSNLATINETVIQRKVSINNNNNNNTPKKSPLLFDAGEFADYKVSSDASNSALP